MEQLSPKLIDYLLNLASTSEYGPALVLAFSLLFMLVYILKTSSPVTVVEEKEDTSPSTQPGTPPGTPPNEQKYEDLYEKLLDAQNSAQDYYNTTVRLRDENLELHERIHDLTQKLPLYNRSLDDDDESETQSPSS